MGEYLFPKQRAGKIGFGIFFFLILLLARDTMITESLIGFVPSQLLMIGLIGCCGVVFLVWNRNRLKDIFTDRRIALIGGAAVIVLVPMLLKLDWQLMYLSILICIGFAVLLTYFMDIEEVSRYYVWFVTFLALYSLLVTYCLKPLVEGGILHVPHFANINGMKLMNFGFAFVVDEAGYFRNFGFCREPGVYQFFLILAVYLNNHVVKWDGWKMWAANIILAVTMLSTFSTNGIIEIGLFTLVLFVDKKLYKDKRIMAAAAVLLALMMVGLVFVVMQRGALYWAIYSVFEKLFVMNESSSSRLGSILLDLNFFMRSPLIGCGVGEVINAVPHNTTSTMLMFAIFGVGGGVLSLASWAALTWDKNRHAAINLAYLVILLMSFNTQNLIADVFFWLFPVMALTNVILQRTEKNARRKSKQKRKRYAASGAKK